MRAAGDIAAYVAKLISGNREQQNGTKHKNFDNIAKLWNAYLQIRRDPVAPLDAVDHAHMMVLMKIARTQSGNYNPDDWDDMTGYSACAGEVASIFEDARRRLEMDEKNGPHPTDSSAAGAPAST